MPRTSTSPASAAEIGCSIRDYRQELGVTQARLAERLAVSPAYLSKVEAGRSNATIGMLARIAAALDARLVVRFDPR